MIVVFFLCYLLVLRLHSILQNASIFSYFRFSVIEYLDYMEIAINSQWNGLSINHEAVHFKCTSTNEGLKINVRAPFFNDPPPDGETGKPMWFLWDYEGITVF